MAGWAGGLAQSAKDSWPKTKNETWEPGGNESSSLPSYPSLVLTVSPKEATTTSKQRGDYEYMYIQVDLDNLIYPIAKALESTKQVTRG